MTQTSRDNHFVPQLYLKNWSDDGNHIWAYRILVSHKNVPEWEYRSIEKTAYFRDLYTYFAGEKEIDDYERWLAEEIEYPAIDALKKVLKNNPLNPSDWDKYRGKILNSRGGWFAGKGAFSHGFDINKDLVGQISYLQLLILNATGRLPEERLAQMVGAAFMGLSWPDSRIWCNQIGAFAGTMRTTAVAATTAGILAGDSG